MKGKILFLTLTLSVLTSTALDAQSLTILHTFTNSPDGALPWADLLLLDGTLYGTTQNGGSNNTGIIFSINKNGSNFTVLHEFPALNDGTNSDGAYPGGGLLFYGSKFYGTTHDGGHRHAGTLYSLNTNGSNFVPVHQFELTNSNGAYPRGNLIVSGETLYGTTEQGGDTLTGTVFSIKTNGQNFALLHHFDIFSTNNGAIPHGGLVLTGETLFGTTENAGTNGAGVIFSLKTNGASFKVLHSFDALLPATNADGTTPYGSLILLSNKLYGTALMGGPYYGGGGGIGFGTAFSVETNGDNFHVIAEFNGANGSNPYAGLFLTSNTLYGTTSEWAGGGSGTIFSFNIDGTGFSEVYHFTDIWYGPRSAVILSSNVLYGTLYDGLEKRGAVFRLELCSPRPAITNIVLNTNNTVTISCLGSPGYTYFMIATTNLATPMISWQTMSTNVADTNGTWQVTDPITASYYVCYTNINNTTNIIIAPGPGGGGTYTNYPGTNIVCEWKSNRFYRAVSQCP